MRIKCVVNNTHGKENKAGRKAKQVQRKQNAEQMCGKLKREGEEAPETPRFRRSRDTREQDDLLLCEALWFNQGGECRRVHGHRIV